MLRYIYGCRKMDHPPFWIHLGGFERVPVDLQSMQVFAVDSLEARCSLCPKVNNKDSYVLLACCSMWNDMGEVASRYCSVQLRGELVPSRNVDVVELFAQVCLLVSRGAFVELLLHANRDAACHEVHPSEKNCVENEGAPKKFTQWC